MKRRKTSLPDRILFFINILVGCALLLSYLAYFVDPGFLTVFALAALGYPILLALNILFVFYWLVRLKWKILLPLFCILVGYKHIGRTFRLSPTKIVANEEVRLKVMTYNVRMFNAYEWISETNIPDAIQDLVQRHKPDVLLIQEYHKSKMDPALGFPYDFRKFTNEGENYGLTIFSEYPIVNAGALPYFLSDSSLKKSANNEFVFADILWGGDTIRFINVHFASIKLGPEEYERLKNPNQGSQEDIKRGFVKILKLLHRAFQQRAKQVEPVEKAIAESPHPVILCGDFNDTPQSYTYHRIDEYLGDAYTSAGQGLSGTYSRGPLPLRIDHIFYDDEFYCREYQVLREKYSDHYPVMAQFEWKK